MAKYKITWKNELEGCRSPLEAAKECLDVIERKYLLEFFVTAKKSKKKWKVDLNCRGKEAVERIS